MAKGDDKRARNAIDYRGNMAQQNLDNQRVGMVNPTYQNAQDAWRNATNEAPNDYRAIMDQFRNFQTTQQNNPVTAERVNYQRTPEMEEAFGNYRNFAQTGGFSGDDVRDMRARGISPIRAVYANAQNELGRQRALQGGYSPNYTAAAAKMSGRLSGQLADATQDVNARLAEMVQKGKMFGSEGFGNLSVSDTGFGQNAQIANQRAALEAAQINKQNTDNLRLGAIQGQANLFGTRPGMAETFGGQTLDAVQAGNQLQAMQNQLGLGIPENAIRAGQLPGKWESNIGRIGDIMDIGTAFWNPIADTPNSASVYNNGPNGEFW
jgi:hypothetical protein